ncbi:MAG: hypothetical protein ACFFCX_15360 [Candidatus Sifarchaeia archaeon]
MVEFVKGKALVGPVVTMFGGIYSLVIGLFGVNNSLTIYLALFEANPMTIVPAVLALIFGIIILLLGFFAAKGNMTGNYITLVLGIVLVLAWLFVLQPPPPPVPEITYYIFGAAPIVFTAGGLLGVFLKE